MSKKVKLVKGARRKFTLESLFGNVGGSLDGTDVAYLFAKEELDSKSREILNKLSRFMSRHHLVLSSGGVESSRALVLRLVKRVSGDALCNRYYFQWMTECGRQFSALMSDHFELDEEAKKRADALEEEKRKQSVAECDRMQDIMNAIMSRKIKLEKGRRHNKKLL